MSPEQLQLARLTPASDIYSAGMVMFECLMGRDALHGHRLGDQLERLQAVSAFVPTPQLVAAAPQLVDVIRRMTTTNPGRRLPNASAALSALDSGGPVRAPQPRPARRRTGVALVIAVCVVLVGLAVVVMFREPASPPLPTLPPSVAPTSSIPAPAVPIHVEDAGLEPADLSLDSTPANDASVACTLPTPSSGWSVLPTPVGGGKV